MQKLTYIVCAIVVISIVMLSVGIIILIILLTNHTSYSNANISSSTISNSTTNTATTSALTTITQNDYNPCRTSILISIDGANSSTYAQYQRQRDFIANQLVTNQSNHFDRIAVSLHASECTVPIANFTDIQSYVSFQSTINATDSYYNLCYVTSYNYLFYFLSTTIHPDNGFMSTSGAQQTIVFASSTPTSADLSMNPIVKQWANYLRYRGSLIIVVMGPNINITEYIKLTPNVYQWIDFDNPSPTLANDILESFSCGKFNNFYTCNQSSATNPHSTPTPPTTTSSPGYFPCFSKIFLIIDDSIGVDQYNQEVKYITNQLVTDRWTHFDRIAVRLASEGGYYWLGSFASFHSFQSGLNDTEGDNGPSTNLPMMLYEITTYFQAYFVHNFSLDTYANAKQQVVVFIADRSNDEIVRSIPWAQYINAIGRLIIVVMETDVVDINKYYQLTSNVFRWLDYNNPPAQMAKQIVDKFSC